MGRTNIVIDDDLMGQAMSLTGAKTRRQAVDLALRELIRQRATYRKLLALRGKLHWDGDLAASRRSRV